jgi:hypothetical protein
VTPFAAAHENDAPVTPSCDRLIVAAGAHRMAISRRASWRANILSMKSLKGLDRVIYRLSKGQTHPVLTRARGGLVFHQHAHIQQTAPSRASSLRSNDRYDQGMAGWDTMRG